MNETAIATAMESEADTACMVRQIAHELRQPLSTIESIAYYLDLILPRDEPRARVQLERLQKLVEQSNWIVSNAVHFVQASAAVPQCLDLGELVGSAASDCNLGASLQVDLHDTPLIRLDPAQAVHLFRNLLMFFRQIASPEHPAHVSADCGPGLVSVRISTTAPGYSSSEVHSLFQPFSAGLPAGSGLSLASVARIVEAHEGRVEIEADPDSGVAFTLILPA